MPSNRVSPSTADYLTIALSPLLVMMMVGSLVFFLIEVFYSGQYQGRINWIMFWFVMAAVLIARISMIEGAQQASLYGVALAVVTALVLTRFVDAVLLAWALLALSWWCAHMLTRDSTHIDESEEPSGEGLMQSAGLEERLGDWDEEPARREESSQSAASHPTAKQQLEDNDHADSAAAAQRSTLDWIRRRFFGKRRARAPGVWVVYFSLAALPLFGIGQLLIPVADQYRRRYAFLMLLIYLSSGLGLLLTTTFLGLRRYLRSRRLEMPPAMTTVWLSVGALTAAGVLVLALLLPRPQAEYAISSLSGLTGTGSHEASRVAVLRDSPTQGEGRGSNRPSDRVPNDPSSSPPSESGTARNESNESSSDSGSPDSQRDSGSRANRQDGDQTNQSDNRAQSSPGDSSSAGQDDERDQNEDQQTSEANNQPDRTDSNGRRDDRSSNNAGRRQSSGSESGDRKPTDGRSSSGRQSQGQNSQPPSRSPSPPSPGISPSGALLAFLKWAIYLAIICAACYLGWRYRRDLIAAIGQMLRALGEFWRRLFGSRGRSSDEDDAESPLVARPRPFAQYPDPFAGGLAGDLSIEELLRYSFDALDAWSREKGQGRGADETPIEFCKRVARRQPQIAAEARELGALYAGSTYGRVEPADSCRQTLRRLWRHLTLMSTQATPADVSHAD